MELNAIYLYLGKHKRAILKDLKSKDANFTKQKNRYVFTNQSFLNLDKVDIIFYFMGNICFSIGIEYQAESITRNPLFELTKTRLIDELGKPTSSNANHQTTDIYMYWNQDYTTELRNIENKQSIRISFNTKTKVGKLSLLNRVVLTFLLSISIGFLWGILFFLLMGLAYGYDWLLFQLSMGGGLFFGLSFVVIFAIAARSNKKTVEAKIFTKKVEKLFDTYEKNHQIMAPYQRCLVTFRNKSKVAFYKTTIYFEPHKFVFSYIRNNRIYDRTLPHISIEFYLDVYQNQEIIIFLTDQTRLSVKNKDGLETLINRLNHILGYQEDTFMRLHDTINQTLVDYDLLSLIEGGQPVDFFKLEASNITRIIFKDQPKTALDVEKILLDYFGHMPIASFTELSEIIFRQFNHIIFE